MGMYDVSIKPNKRSSNYLGHDITANVKMAEVGHDLAKYSQTRLVRPPLKSSDLLISSVPSETIITPLTIHVKSPS